MNPRQEYGDVFLSMPAYEVDLWGRIRRRTKRRGDIPDFVKVLDFGLIKARNLEGQVELTGATATLGTPLYMSPEAVEHPDKVDARTDLYSLGAVGYYLVTGETVFFGATIGEVLRQQAKAEPDKPSARMREPLSADFEDLLLRCLAKSPEDRPAGARELEAALGRCAAATQWGRELAEDWWRCLPHRHPPAGRAVSAD